MAGALQPTTGFAKVSGGELYYEAAGAGHPLVLLHAGIADCRMWNDQLGALTRGCRVIRYDARGFGRSRTEDVSFSDRQDLSELLDQLGVESASLLGISRGGQIALDFALEYPARVDALILAAAGLSGYQHPPTEAESPAMRVFAEMDAAWEKREFARLVDMEVRMFVDGPGQPPDRVDHRVRERVREMRAHHFRREDGEARPEPLDPPAVDRLAEIRVPTLVLVGDLDTAGARAMADRLEQGIAGARRVVFPGVAHMLNLERPEKFNRVVLDFLGSMSQPAAG
jgi:3-oxoadipate enol-lactonase